MAREPSRCFRVLLSAPNPWRCRVGRRRFVVLTVGGWHSRSALAPPPAFPYQYHHNGDERGPDKRGQGMESPTRGEEDEQPDGGVDDVFGVQGLIPPIACRLGWWARRCHGANVCVGGGALGPRTRVRARRRSGTTRKANPWLCATLVEAANGASRTRDTYLVAQYHRLLVRLGRKKAIMAVATAS